MTPATIHILLVEDSPSDAYLLEQTLCRTGSGQFEFTWVECLGDAVARLSGESFDVLMLDLCLPDSSGPETFRRVRKAAPGLPIVVLTGTNDESLGLAAVQEGVQDYLVKGETEGPQIARVIRYAIERKQAEEELRRQREWLRVTLTSIGDAVLAGDTAGRVTFLNPAAESLTGWKMEEALGQPIRCVFQIIDEETRQEADDLVARVLRENRIITVDNHTSLLTRDGREVAIEDSAAPILGAAGAVAGVVLVFHDVTEKRHAQKEREVTLELLRLVNQSSDTRELIQAAAAFFQRQSGCEAVGVRLKEGDDYPYVEARGFPQEFVSAETTLCSHNGAGQVVRDSAGNPVFECLCGNVICGRVDLSKPFFTDHGSFWTNGTTELLASTSEEDRQTRTRNRCQGEGYESVALIPLRVGDARLGLLQFNDRRKGVFSPEAIQLWERLADQLAVAVAKLRAEQALVRAKEEWERTFDSVPDLIVILDDQHRIVRANRAMAQRLGLTPEQCIGQNCYKCVHGASRPPEFCPHARTLRDGREHISEIHEDKLGGDFLVSTTPLHDENGRMLGSVHVARDITERKRAEAALRESREDLNRAQAVAHTGSWRLDTRHNEVLWSDETYRIFGISKGGRLTYQEFLASVHPLDRDFVERSWQATLGGAPYDIEHRIVVGGDVKWVRGRAELELDPDGVLAGAFGTVQDITERRRTEEKIRHQNALLEGVNRILREALACGSEEELGRICLAIAEEVTESKFGFLGEIGADRRLKPIAMSDPGWEAGRMTDVSRPGLVTGFEIPGVYGRVLADGKGFFTNAPASHPDGVGIPEGHPRLTSFLGVPLKHDGKTIGMIAVGNREGGYRPQDLEGLEALALSVAQVLMQKRAEHAVRAGEERLRQAQKMESIALLAGGVAHDFNNLLVGVIGNASLSIEMLPRRSPARNLLERIVKSGEQAAHLTRQMLAYSGKGQFVIEPVNLSEVVREVTDLVRSTTPKKIPIQLDLKPGLPAIEADRSQIHQVLMNLVINATEAIGDQSGLIAVQTGVQDIGESFLRELERADISPGRHVYLEVRDNGCGMDEATKAKIFDPFFTTKFQGRGLGLAAVAGIVRAQNGAIRVKTAPGKGTSFLILFPVMGSQPAAPLVTRSQAIPENLSGYGTVLVIDDEEVVQATARLCLERRGVSVLVAGSGAEGIDVLRKNAAQVALVILDLSMPGMSGQEALPKLLAIKPELDVVVSSGYTEADALRLFSGMRVAGFIQKPYTAQRLAGKVKAVLEHTDN